MSNILQSIGKTTFITGLFITCSGLFPTLLGFGQIGIVYNSFAALIQSMIGNVAGGSTFAYLTSLGMKGVFVTTSKIGSVLGIGGLITYIKGKSK